MNLEIIGRHIEVAPELKDFIAKRADKLQKFFDRVHSLKVAVSCEGSGHTVEFVAHLVKSDMIVAKGTAPDVYDALDMAAEKLEHQLRRYKEKLRDHRSKPETQRSEGVAEET